MAQRAQDEVVQIPADIGIIPDNFDLRTITSGDVAFAIGAVVVGILLSWLTKRLMMRAMNRIEHLPPLAGDMIARIASYLVLLMAIIIALEALGLSLGTVGGILLIVALLVGLAARPLLQDLGAGLILQMRRPFAMGDQIDIDGSEGRVEEVSARTVQMVSIDGRRIHFPNRAVLDGRIVNMTSEGRRMTTFIAGVRYDTDLDRACEVIVTALGGAAGVVDDPAPEALVKEFGDSAVNIACRFWHPGTIEEEWIARDHAMRAVKRAFDINGITIAFPQRVLWDGHEATSATA